jgi:hypothetical protein
VGAAVLSRREGGASLKVSFKVRQWWTRERLLSVDRSSVLNVEVI